jgi:hypothetical protein
VKDLYLLCEAMMNQAFLLLYGLFYPALAIGVVMFAV